MRNGGYRGNDLFGAGERDVLIRALCSGCLWICSGDSGERGLFVRDDVEGFFFGWRVDFMYSSGGLYLMHVPCKAEVNVGIIFEMTSKNICRVSFLIASKSFFFIQTMIRDYIGRHCPEGNEPSPKHCALNEE